MIIVNAVIEVKAASINQNDYYEKTYSNYFVCYKYSKLINEYNTNFKKKHLLIIIK